MRAGDVIVSVDGKPTPTTAALSQVLATLSPADTVLVVVRHQPGTTARLHVTLGTYPGS